MEIESRIEKSEESLSHLIDVAALFEENRYLEAVRQKRLNEYQILQLTEDVKLWHSRMRKESIRLAAFSERFPEDFATDDNMCFQNAFDLLNRVRSTISGSRKVFRRFCRRVMKTPSNPEASHSVYDRSLLGAHVVSRDIFGMKSYDENVHVLYDEMAAFFTTLVLTLSLCHRMIQDEALIRSDAKRCLAIYKKCREEILASARLFAKTFNVRVETISESELIQRRRKAKSMDEYAQHGYHRINKEEFLTIVAYEVISEGNRNGLTDAEALLFGTHVDKALRVRQVISRFNELTDSQKKIDGKLLVEFIKWCGVKPDHEHKLYDHFRDEYKGGLHVVGWTQVFGKRKELMEFFSDEQLAESFENLLKKLDEQVA